MNALIKKYWVVLVITIGLILLFFARSIKTTRPVPVPPTPTPVVFELINIYPPAGERQLPLQNLAIDFTFSKPLDVSATLIQIKPFTNFETSTSSKGKVLSIYPLENWEYNIEYAITIEPKSEDGQSLSAAINYTFKPTPFTDSPMIE